MNEHRLPLDPRLFHPNQLKDAVEMNDLVRNEHTQFEGTVRTLCWHLGRANQACAYPNELDEKGIPRNGYWSDVCNLTIIEKGESPEFNQSQFELGDFVVHKYSPLQGTVIAKILHSSGCWEYIVQPDTVQENGKPTDEVSFPEAHVQSLTLTPTIPQKKELALVADKPGGSPTRYPTHPR